MSVGRILPENDENRYTPLSGLAIAAILVSGITALVIAGLTIAARLAAKPAYQPLLLVPAIVGLALAIAARWTIRRSEGSRTGMGMATTAWWLAALFGGGYGAYIVATELAVRQQAEAAINAWFDKLSHGTSEAAFLDCVEPSARASMDPTNSEAIQNRFAAQFTMFRDSDLVRTVRQAEGKIKLDLRGVAGWQDISGGYEVNPVIEFRTPEGRYSFIVPVVGMDSREQGKRVWTIQFRAMKMLERELTQCGRLIRDLETESRNELAKWAGLLNDGKVNEAFIGTLKLADRERLEGKTDALEFTAFKSGSLIVVDGKPPIATERPQLAIDLMAPRAINLLPGTGMNPVGPPQCVINKDGSIRIYHSAEVMRSTTAVPVVATIAMEVMGDALLAEIHKLRGDNWESNPVLPANAPFSVMAIDSFKRDYRVVEINLKPNAQRLGQPQPMQQQ